MLLKDFLNVYKSTNKIYIEQYINKEVSHKVAFFKDVKQVPSDYLNSKVAEWTYKFEVVDMKMIEMIPIAKIIIGRG